MTHNKPKLAHKRPTAEPNKAGSSDHQRNVGDSTEGLTMGKGDHSPRSSNDRDAKADKPKAYEGKNFVVSLLTLFAVVIYAAITAWQAYLTREISTTSQKQLAGTVRPWIGLDEQNGLHTDEITVTKDGGVSSKCTIRPKNFGNYPAQNVLPMCDFMVIQSSIVPVHQRLIDICREHVPEQAGFYTFPKSE